METGKSIKENILQNKRAGYGEEVMSTLSKRLTEKYGKGWSAQQLRHCLRSAETFSKTQILSAVRRELSWIQVKTIMYLDNELKCEFYFEMTVHEKWSTR